MLYEQVRTLEDKYKALLATNSTLVRELSIANNRIDTLKSKLSVARDRAEAYRESAAGLLQYKRILNSIADCTSEDLTVYAVELYRKMRE